MPGRPVEPSSPAAMAALVTLLKNGSKHELDGLLESIKCTWSVLESYGAGCAGSVASSATTVASAAGWDPGLGLATTSKLGR